MLLAELEVWHTRPRAPTRRIALGHLVLPVEPVPGFGGLLLGAVLATHIRLVDGDLVPDVHRLIDQIQRADRVVQPRLRHRYQVDRHGLACSVHRLEGEGDELTFHLDSHGTPLQQVLGATYALERLDPALRRALAPVLRRAMQWHGPLGSSFVAHLAGTTAVNLAALANPRAWALETLGFPLGTTRPPKKDVMARFRQRLREVHPDHGGDGPRASRLIGELGEARRILLEV